MQSQPAELNVSMHTDEFVFTVLMHFPVSQSHIFSVLSPAPDRNLEVVQSTSMHQTAPWCPSNVPRRSPFSEYHTFGLGSFDDENNRSPSRLYLICVIARSCPCNSKGFYKNNQNATFRLGCPFQYNNTLI